MGAGPAAARQTPQRDPAGQPDRPLGGAISPQTDDLPSPVASEDPEVWPLAMMLFQLATCLARIGSRNLHCFLFLLSFS